jgi:hypothetical protein
MPGRGQGTGAATRAGPVPRYDLGEEPDELRTPDLCSVCGTGRRRTLRRLPGGTYGDAPPRNVRGVTRSDRRAAPGADPLDRAEDRAELVAEATPPAPLLAVAGLQLAHPPDLGLDELIDVAVEHRGGVAGLDARTQVLDDLVRVEDVVADLGAP